MAITLPGGFNITNNEPVDARITVADQSARLGFSNANVFEGLVVYQRDNDTLYVLVDASNPSSNDSWTPIASVNGNIFPYTGSAIITGSLEVIGFSTLTGSLFVEGSIGYDALAVYSGSEKKVSVNSEGVLALDEFLYTPSAVKGGLMYSASNFWLGIE